MLSLVFLAGFPQGGRGYNSVILNRFKIEKIDTKTKERFRIAKVAEDISLRLGPKLEVKTLGDDTIDVSFFKDNDLKERDKLTNKIERIIETVTKKPIITMTDERGNPLFFKGSFNPQPLQLFRRTNLSEELFSPPLGPESASYRFDSARNEHLIDIKGRDGKGEVELTKAKLNALKGLSAEKNKIYIWLNYRKLLQQIEIEDPVGFNKAGQNPITYLKFKKDETKKDDIFALFKILGGGAEERLSDFKNLGRSSLLGIISVNAVNANTPFGFKVYPSLGSRGREIVAIFNLSQSEYKIKHIFN